MRIRIAVLCLMMGLAMPTAGASDGEADELVTAFNQALSNRDMETMLSLLADGAVRFNLRPSHQGLTEDTLTQDLKLHWQTVGSVLFSVTETYQRSIQVTAVHVDADLATVWVETQTRSVSRSDGSESLGEFSEVYLLARKDSMTWQIIGMADNRESDDLSVSN